MLRSSPGSTCIGAIALTILGCGSEEPSQQDAAVAHDAAIDAGLDAALDAPPDAPPDAACERTLLADGMALGWTLRNGGPNSISYGADYVALQTSTTPGQSTSGQLLLTYAGAITAGAPFKLEVVALVQAVNPHNQFDSGAAILGSFTPPNGAGADRSQMIYLDAGAIGWADDTQSHAVTVTDGAYHTYVLAVDAAGAAQVTIDGAPALTRSGFTTTGTIAIGDQTNDPNVDGTIRIRSVRLLCP